MEHTKCVGIDVAKDHLDVHVRPIDESFRVTHDEAGVVTLLARLRTVTPTIVVLEASGGYEVALTATSASAGLPVAVVNPRQIRDYARAIGQLAKTDRLDAQIIARFAEQSALSRARSRTPKLRHWASSSPGGTSLSTCSQLNRTGGACCAIVACSATSMRISSGSRRRSAVSITISPLSCAPRRPGARPTTCSALRAGSARHLLYAHRRSARTGVMVQDGRREFYGSTASPALGRIDCDGLAAVYSAQAAARQPCT
jgi:hypothetical protein